VPRRLGLERPDRARSTYQKSDDPKSDPVPIGRVAQNTVTVSVEIRY
jgi:hypothetical protein